MATVTYEGVGGRGNLFQGTKFFITQRVPMRTTWVDMVESNGGVIVKLEKQADCIIGDHAKKNQPPGSISWRYIEMSVKKGELQNPEDYPAGPTERQVRSTGSSQAIRTGRVPFTAEDDAVLANWVAKAERKGLSLKGNDIYIQLENKNNRHTFQSWRDHWLKVLSHKPRPQRSEEEDGCDAEGKAGKELSSSSPQQRLPASKRHIEEQGPSNVRTRHMGSRPVVEIHRTTRKKQRSRSPEPYISKINQDVEEVDMPSSPPASQPARKPNGSDSANVFSDADTELLLEVYGHMLSLREDHIIDAWMKWSQEHPHHTAQEWRNYFTEYVIPKRRAIKEAEKAKNTVDGKAANIEVQNSSSEIETSTQSPAQSPKPTPKDSTPVLTSSQQWPQKPTETKDSQNSSGLVTQTPNAETKGMDHTTIDEDEFRSKVCDLAETWELQVNFYPKILGRSISLFSLWQVVNSDEFGGFDNVNGRGLWSNVAARLNLADYYDAGLKSCYEEVLAGLENLIREYEEELATTSSQDAAAIRQQLIQPLMIDDADSEKDDLEEPLEEIVGESEVNVDTNDHPQLSPQQMPRSPRKRSFDYDTPQRGSYNKRQRIDKGKGRSLDHSKEIPSTPEDVFKGVGSRSFDEKGLTLSATDLESSDDRDNNLDLHMRPKTMERAKKSDFKSKVHNFEPETQDFHFSQDQGLAPKDMEGRSPFNAMLPPQRAQSPSPGPIVINRQSFTNTEQESSTKSARVASSISSKSPTGSVSNYRSTKSSNRPAPAITIQPSSSMTSRTDVPSSSSSHFSKNRATTFNPEDLESVVDHYVKLGYAQEVVVQALAAVNLDTDTSSDSKANLDAVLEGLTEKGAIPDALPGVWTTMDDSAVMKPKGSAEFERVTTKHTIYRVGARRQALRKNLGKFIDHFAARGV